MLFTMASAAVHTGHTLRALQGKATQMQINHGRWYKGPLYTHTHRQTVTPTTTHTQTHSHTHSLLPTAEQLEVFTAQALTSAGCAAYSSLLPQLTHRHTHTHTIPLSTAASLEVFTAHTLTYIQQAVQPTYILQYTTLTA